MSASAQGYAAGRAEGLEASRIVLAGLEAALSDLDVRVVQELEGAYQFAAELALTIGSRLAGEVIAAGGHDVERLLSDALAARSGPVSRVLMSKADHEVLLGLKSERRGEEPCWGVDPALGPGEFVVETATGRLVATLEARLETLREEMAS
ncbi:MAG: hypothetical protein JKY65_31735 [Planctomycetes bacterium]|nr:hypothetical protein [Planctomycetota bacterium]